MSPASSKRSKGLLDSNMFQCHVFDIHHCTCTYLSGVGFPPSPRSSVDQMETMPLEFDEIPSVSDADLHLCLMHYVSFGDPNQYACIP